MTQAQQIANAIERSIDGPMWHGPALRELLSDVSSEEAAHHPLTGLHSIWEIVAHLAAWVEIAGRRLQGEQGEPSEAVNWLAVSLMTRDAWKIMLEALWRIHQELAQAVNCLTADQLSATLPGRNHSVQAMLQGIVEHDAYHGGQIAVLKRALRTLDTRGF
jgi:uncharacterized damage-inducible protein DinB